MPVKAGALVAQKMELKNLDPSGDTWVWVRPATGRACLQRGELLTNKIVTPDGLQPQCNPVMLQNEEIWLTAGNEDGEIGHIVVEYEGEDEPRIFFQKKKDDYTKSEFLKELMELPPIVAATWVSLVRQANQAWIFPI